MQNRKRAFTLPELLVVMGIIILFIALAVPAVNSITGARSIAAGENNLGAVLGRAREEAIGLQEIRGILFIVDPATDRVMAVMVHQTDSPKMGTFIGANYSDVIWLDTVPNRESMLLPVGIRVQTTFDSVYVGTTERYLGLNANKDPIGGPPIGDNKAKLGGVILFDGNGRLVVRPYGFRLAKVDALGRPIGNSASGVDGGTGIADLLFLQPGIKENGDTSSNPDFIPFNQGSSGSGTIIKPRSQVALLMIDKKTYETAGFVDADGQQNEAEKENWIDANATPILINRFTGEMIRGE